MARFLASVESERLYSVSPSSTCARRGFAQLRKVKLVDWFDQTSWQSVTNHNTDRTRVPRVPRGGGGASSISWNQHSWIKLQILQ